MDKKTQIIIMLTLLLAFSLIFVYTEKSRSNSIELGKPLSNHWACMDGCSNMQEILEFPVEYNNMTQKAHHDECADRCYLQYFEVDNG